MKLRAAGVMAIVFLGAHASARDLPRFGIGVNSSIMAARTFGEPEVPVTPGETPGVGSPLPATGAGTVSLRWWATERFGIEPNIGVSLRDTPAGTLTALTLGLRTLYSIVRKKSFRGNVGFDVMVPLVTGGGRGTSIAPGVGPLLGVEYFFDEENTFSFEVYVGAPVILPVDGPLRVDIGGNVMAGFHFYLW